MLGGTLLFPAVIQLWGEHSSLQLCKNIEKYWKSTYLKPLKCKEKLLLAKIMISAIIEIPLKSDFTWYKQVRILTVQA